jgi:hypothetical protein
MIDAACNSRIPQANFVHAKNYNSFHAHPGAMEAHSGLVEIYNGAVEICLGAFGDSQRGLGVLGGAIKNHPEAVEALP